MALYSSQHWAVNSSSRRKKCSPASDVLLGMGLKLWISARHHTHLPPQRGPLLFSWRGSWRHQSRGHQSCRHLLNCQTSKSEKALKKSMSGGGWKRIKSLQSTVCTFRDLEISERPERLPGATARGFPGWLERPPAADGAASSSLRLDGFSPLIFIEPTCSRNTAYSLTRQINAWIPKDHQRKSAAS